MDSSEPGDRMTPTWTWKFVVITMIFLAGFYSGYYTASHPASSTPDFEDKETVTCYITADNSTPHWMCFSSGDVTLRINPPSNATGGNVTLSNLTVSGDG